MTTEQRIADKLRRNMRDYAKKLDSQGQSKLANSLRNIIVQMSDDDLVRIFTILEDEKGSS